MEWCITCNKMVDQNITVYSEIRDGVGRECREYRCSICNRYLGTTGGFYD